MKSELKVLLVGKDGMLLRTRQLILGTFFQVETAGRVSHAAGILGKDRFDLIVLCHTLSNDERQQMAELVRDHSPVPQTLALSTAGGPGAPIGDYREVSLDGGPYTLVKKCAEILGVELKGMGRASRQAVR